jgi:hypothetical protein
MINMALRLSGYDLRAFLRNRQSQFFTLALPVLFLVIFASVLVAQRRPFLCPECGVAVQAA